MLDPLGLLWKFGKGRVTVTVTFEIVDDPGDLSEHRGHVKAVNVWYVALNMAASPKDLTPEVFHAHGRLIGSITRNTPREFRVAPFNDTPGAEGYLYVRVEPAAEWEHLYEPCQTQTTIKTGRHYNLCVFVKRKVEPRVQEPPPARLRKGKLNV